MRRIVIVGATSGLGYATARCCLEQGWTVGAAGRRIDALAPLGEAYPGQLVVRGIDVLDEDAGAQLRSLVEALGGMEVLLLSSGIGRCNPRLDPQIERDTLRTNCEGFARIVATAYTLFCEQGGGRLAVITSVAGTRGIGCAASYSASKRFQSTYIDALAQLARNEHVPVRFTEIRPGFVSTPMLHYPYPMQMQPDRVAGRIVRAVEKGRRRVTIDWRYAALVALWRMLPAPLWERLPFHCRA